MAEFVSHHAGHFALVFGLLEHSPVNEHRAAGEAQN